MKIQQVIRIKTEFYSCTTSDLLVEEILRKLRKPPINIQKTVHMEAGFNFLLQFRLKFKLSLYFKTNILFYACFLLYSIRFPPFRNIKNTKSAIAHPVQTKQLQGVGTLKKICLYRNVYHPALGNTNSRISNIVWDLLFCSFYLSCRVKKLRERINSGLKNCSTALITPLKYI